MQTIFIPTELAQAIADYLATRPYREVAGMLAALQKAATTPPPSQTPAAETGEAAKTA